MLGELFFFIEEKFRGMQKRIPKSSWGFLKKLFPSTLFFSYLEKQYTNKWVKARKKHPKKLESIGTPNGVNVVGYFRTVKGLSEAARSSAVALAAAKIPCSIVDFQYGIPITQQVELPPALSSGQGFKFNVNLIHINPPQLPYLWRSYGEYDLARRYTIGVWYWELPEFPAEWDFAFNLVDEVWVATQFIYNSVSKKAPIPVVKIPPSVSVAPDYNLKRWNYGLPEDSFLFMCAYDVLSIQARKNPLGAIDAFMRAFAGSDKSVGLVIKVNNARENPIEIQQLYGYVQGYSNCYIIEDVFEKPKFHALIRLVDAYVSLHRSEGFGLIPAEAMCLGKPVIMTNWSGNVDFMTDNNSCGVNYDLVPVDSVYGPYMPNQVWAEPNLEYAAFLMQKLFFDEGYRKRISRNAKKHIREHFSPEFVGKIMKERLLEIGM